MTEAVQAFRDQLRGVWVAYGTDHSYHWSTTVFRDELEARRYAMGNYLQVGFLRYGESLEKAQDGAA